MSKNNKGSITWSQYIISSILALCCTLNVMADYAKRIEKESKATTTTSISTTETTIPTTEIDIETILQDTIPTTEETIAATIPTVEETIAATIPTVEETIAATIPTVEETIDATISTTEETIAATIPTTYIIDNSNVISVEKYITAIDEIEVNYKHKKYYPTEKDTFKIYADASTTAVKCDYQYTGDTHDIGTKLFENSQKYVNENPKYVTAFKDESSQNEELITQQIWFEINLYKILGSWENNTNDINEDFCSLENYNIVFSFDEEEYKSKLAYTTHNTLVIFPKRIELRAAIANEDWVNTLYDVMNHQLNIIRQRACKCRIYRGQSYFQIPAKTLTDAALQFETKYYDTPSMYNLNYYDEKQSEELLLTLGLFRDDVTADDYYNAIYNSDLESFHKFFNATTEEEVNKLYTILYAIDGANLKNNLLLTHYGEDDLVSHNDITTFVGYNYKIDIFKIVLKNMIQYTNTHSDFTFEDNLIMYKYIEGLIVKDSYEILDVDLENNSSTIRYEDDFTENIYNLRNIYYEFLCNKYNVSSEEIGKLENTNISYKLIYINQYCHNDYHHIPERYYYTIENLVERFPLLKVITNTHKSLFYDIKEFETHTR